MSIQEEQNERKEDEQIIIPQNIDQRAVYLEREQALHNATEEEEYRRLYGIRWLQSGNNGAYKHQEEERTSAEKEMDRLDDKCVAEVAERHGLSLAQVGLISSRGFDEKWEGWELANQIDNEDWTY